MKINFGEVMALVSVFCCAASPAAGQQQLPPAPAGKVVGVRNFAHSVADLDKAISFYQTVFGMAAAAPIGKPQASDALQELYGTKGATFRQATLKIPGAAFGFQLMEFTGIDRKSTVPRHTDPGAADLNARVRDHDAAFAALQKAGAPVITVGGAPVRMGPGGAFQSVFVRDPDGYVLEVIRAGMPPPDAPNSNLYGAVIAMTTGDTDKSFQFYKDLLGMDQLSTGQWSNNKTIMDMVGAGGGQFRQSQCNIPGTAVRYEFYEYKDLPQAQTPFHPRIQDPGAVLLSLYVRDIDEMTKLVKQAGVPVVTPGGAPVKTDAGRSVLVRDPNGVFVELVQQ
jgi:catechol 2,3-dioxygenase-like lactoylglutathione lyase family enzyme